MEITRYNTNTLFDPHNPKFHITKQEIEWRIQNALEHLQEGTQDDCETESLRIELQWFCRDWNYHTNKIIKHVYKTQYCAESEWYMVNENTWNSAEYYEKLIKTTEHYLYTQELLKCLNTDKPIN